MNLPNLPELFNQKGFDYYPTDKGTTHNYLDFYDMLFRDFRHKDINIFEVGVNIGGSIRLFNDYFSKARIICCDISRNADMNILPKTSIYLVKDFKNIVILDDFKNLPITIAIDDGSHDLEDQIHFIKMMYPIIEDGGMLIIEDIQDIVNEKKYFDELNIPYAVFDLRSTKGRYDDVLLIFKK